MSQQMLDVIILTYNHQNWIEQAINSVLLQDCTNIDTIFVADDASTDNTPNIVINIAEKSQRKIKLIRREQNLGINKNYFDAVNHCQSEYVAFLEGDDYWCNPSKISQQLRILKDNPDYIACVHPVQVIDAFDRNLDENLPNMDVSNLSIFDPYLIMPIYPPGFHTGSLVVKTDIIRQCYHSEFDASPAKDMAVHYLLTQMGVIGYIPHNLGVYRRLEKSAFNIISTLKRISLEIQTHLRLHPHLHGKLADFHSKILDNHLRLWNEYSTHPDYISELPDMIKWIDDTNDQILIDFLLG